VRRVLQNYKAFGGRQYVIADKKSKLPPRTKPATKTPQRRMTA
jgi:hypothetical protein